MLAAEVTSVASAGFFKIRMNAVAVIAAACAQPYDTSGMLQDRLEGGQRQDAGSAVSGAGPNPALCGTVQALLCAQRSPEQIAGILAEAFPDAASYRVSHETIYTRCIWCHEVHCAQN